MFDEWRTRALVTKASSLRPVFVVFVGLCLVPMLTGCIFTSTRPEITISNQLLETLGGTRRRWFERCLRPNMSFN